jgi:hypothetical protein
MYEVFPVVSGIVLGLAAFRYFPARLRWVAVVALSIVLGVTASAISGELAMSWEFILIDSPQVLLVAVITLAACLVWQRRIAHAR